MEHRKIVNWLRESDPERLEELWRQANEARAQNVGDEVHLRGLVELSNHCVRRCAYCGISADHKGLTRYRMTSDEVMDCALEAVGFGYGTVVLQAGEDYGLSQQWVTDVVRRIKQETPLAVTLSLGERKEDFAPWYEAGADRYLLRFETSNREIYERIHPPLGEKRSDRFALLRELGRLGYEVGSGVMIGIPGQGYEDLARDIELFGELNLDMIGVGPYIPHPDTVLGQGLLAPLPAGEQVPNDELMAYKVVALARILCPRTNIPSTTALATLNLAEGRELGLSRGANVVMPNLTPPRYRAYYEIYPNKACLYESSGDCAGCIRRRIESIGRKVGVGRGDSLNHVRPAESPD
jgi:biotin synthase